MKILITGGVKSGKSRHAEKRVLELAETNPEKPLYLATTELLDAEMEVRIQAHKDRRVNKFKTIEEPLQLYHALKNGHEPVLIECLTMWLNNALFHQKNETQIFQEIETLLTLKRDIVFVINEVGLGIIPENPLARQFADMSGKISQLLGESCDEVWWCVAGIPNMIKP